VTNGIACQYDVHKHNLLPGPEQEILAVVLKLAFRNPEPKART
jgi:hypothetical protein